LFKKSTSLSGQLVWLALLGDTADSTAGKKQMTWLWGFVKTIGIRAVKVAQVFKP